jgi:hypothetical protein
MPLRSYICQKHDILIFVENLLLDVRYAIRILRKSPAFTVVALLTLMLGIGANVVVFGVLNTVLLHPLDVSDPQSLYQVRHKQWMIGRLLTTSYPAFEDFRQRNATFSGMAAIYGYSHAALHWRNDPFTVVGVASARFHGTERFVWPDYWVPMLNEQQVEGSDYLHNRTHVAVTVIGRLKPGVTPRQATENLNAIAAELAKEYPTTDDGRPLRLIHPGLIGDEGDVIRGFLYGVTLLALLVLTAACANLASLFASRVADRSRELAVRVALGSSRRRLAMQLLTEAVVVSLMGGTAGLVTANLLLAVLNRWQPAAEAHLAASVDTRVFLEGLALTLGSALLFGMLPAWQAWRSSPLQTMKSGPVDVIHCVGSPSVTCC